MVRFPFESIPESIRIDRVVKFGSVTSFMIHWRKSRNILKQMTSRDDVTVSRRAPGYLWRQSVCTVYVVLRCCRRSVQTSVACCRSGLRSFSTCRLSVVDIYGCSAGKGTIYYFYIKEGNNWWRQSNPGTCMVPCIIWRREYDRMIKGLSSAPDGPGSNSETTDLLSSDIIYGWLGRDTECINASQLLMLTGIGMCRHLASRGYNSNYTMIIKFIAVSWFRTLNTRLLILLIYRFKSTRM